MLRRMTRMQRFRLMVMLSLAMGIVGTGFMLQIFYYFLQHGAIKNWQVECYWGFACFGAVVFTLILIFQIVTLLLMFWHEYSLKNVKH